MKRRFNQRFSVAKAILRQPFPVHRGLVAACDTVTELNASA